LVIGYDVSENQIQQAKDLEDVYKNIKFFVSPSECLDLSDSSVDLVIVATAIHWFNIDDFFKECKRVLKPNGTLAIWSYYLERFKCTNESISEQLTRKLDDFLNFLQPSPKLNHLKTRYRDISPPFQDLVRIDDKFRIKSIRTVDDLINTIRTWSAYQSYHAKHSEANCLDAFKLELEVILQDNEFESELELFLLICRN
jgi:ubiquinone/menaquinone biosynthesis C-methylase UbiE